MFACESCNCNVLKSVCRYAGATGVRLTGAGWGGCCVALVEQERIERFMRTVKRLYYDRLQQTVHFDEVVFATQPCDGASAKRV